MSYASGKHAWGISDRSGRRYRLREMKVEWTGAKVGPDPQALRNPRPESGLAEQRAIQWGWNPVGFNAQPGLSPADNLVATGSVGTVVVVTT
jgi:hypothetical protein